MTEMDLYKEIDILHKDINMHKDIIRLKEARIKDLENEIRLMAQPKGYCVIYIANLLCVNEETVRRWIRNGDLIAKRESKKEGFHVTEEDLINFLIKRKKYRNIAKIYTEGE